MILTFEEAEVPVVVAELVVEVAVEVAVPVAVEVPVPAVAGLFGAEV